MTPNSEINKYTIKRFSKNFGEHGSFRLVSSEEMNDDTNNPKEGLFSHTDDYINLSEVTRKYPTIHEIEIQDKAHYDSLIQITNNDIDMIPLFLKDDDNEVHIISSYNTEVNDIGEHCKLVYLGKPFDPQETDQED